jgi:WhiB family transcriptional regulator, redox-sensing transcriptional regulator
MTTKYKLISYDQDVSWQYEAKCLGMVATTGEDLFFFPDIPLTEGKKHSSRIKQARTLCSVCPVQDQCLEFAIDNDCLGIWAGTTETQRRKIARQRETPEIS